MGAGVYRETVTVAMTSAVAETSIIGDVDGAQTGDAGYVVWTAYTTNDKTAPAAAAACTLAGRDYLTFRNLIFVGNSAAATTFSGSTATATNITIRNCVFMQGGTAGSAMVTHTAAFGAASVWVIDRCLFHTAGAGIVITLPTGSGSDYDANIQITSCRFGPSSAAGVQITSSGTDAQEGGGVDIRNCTFINAQVQTVTTRVSLTIPCTIANSYIHHAAGTALNSSESGNLTENYNLLVAQTPRTNVTAGANSLTTAYAPMYHIGQAEMFGFAPRPFGSPMTYDAPVMAFGDDGTALTTDLLGNIKPGGGRSATRAVGCFEFSNCAVKSTANPVTGANHIRITGPGEHDFAIPVDAEATTVEVTVEWDGTYAGTKPSMSVLNGGEAGVTDATDTATGSASTPEVLSLNFTPTSAGIVTMRLRSSDTNGAGLVDFDDFAVT